MQKNERRRNEGFRTRPPSKRKCVFAGFLAGVLGIIGSYFLSLQSYGIGIVMGIPAIALIINYSKRKE